MKPCSVDDCPKPSRARGMCIAHYNRCLRAAPEQDLVTLRRLVAVGEARALRELVRAHGHLPRCASTVWSVS